MPDPNDPIRVALARSIELQGSLANLAPYQAPAPPPEPDRPAPVTYSALAKPPASAVPMPSGPGNQTVGQATGLSPAEAWIIQHESGGNPEAFNKTVVYDQGKRLGNAFGIGQLVDDRPLSARPHDVGTQLSLFRNYVKQRYGTAEKAQAFWTAHNWYALVPLVGFGFKVVSNHPRYRGAIA